MNAEDKEGCSPKRPCFHSAVRNPPLLEGRFVSRREASYLIAATAASLCVSKTVQAAVDGKLSLIKRAIPSSGEKLPIIGLGTWRVFDVGTSQPERAPLEEVLRVFVERGARVIDSSPMYGRSEEVIGEQFTI